MKLLINLKPILLHISLIYYNYLEQILINIYPLFYIVNLFVVKYQC